MGKVNNKRSKIELIIFTTYYFLNIEELNSNLPKIDKKLYKHFHIYYIGHITIKKLVIVKIFAM